MKMIDYERERRIAIIGIVLSVFAMLSSGISLFCYFYGKLHP